MKLRQIIGWIAAGIFLILGAVVYFALYGYGFTAVVCLLISAVIICYQLLELWAGKHRKSARFIHLIFTSILALLLIGAVGTGLHISAQILNPTQGQCDYVIVLGARVNGTVPSPSLQERLDTAYTYLTANPDAVCVVSGGRGDGELISEGACMFENLTARGIAADRILLEEQATSTAENLRFSLALIQEDAGTMPEAVGIISSEYHLYRAGKILKDLGVSPVSIPAKTQNKALFLNYYLREIPACWKYALMGGYN